MKKPIRYLVHIIVTGILVGGGFLGMKALMAQKEVIKRQIPPVPIPIVRTIAVKTGDHSVMVSGEGTVRPLREINLVPQVGGKVVYVSPALVNGGAFDKDELLLRIDPEDYQLAVTLSQAQIMDSESKLTMLQEEAGAAREEWRVHRSGRLKSQDEPPPLVAKAPQLTAARAKVEADKANLKKAMLNLKRTELKAPFAGRIRQENVDIGQYVSPGQGLATLYSTDAAEVIIPLAGEDLFWLHVPDFTPGHGKGTPATILARVAGKSLEWKGEVVRSEGKIDENTRMVNVVVRVDKPYGRKPPLAIGLFVSVNFEGRKLSEAAEIPRSALRQGNVVWVVENGRIRFRSVTVARVEQDTAIIDSGLNDGDTVVTSRLNAVTDKMVVRPLAVKEEDS